MDGLLWLLLPAAAALGWLYTGQRPDGSGKRADSMLESEYIKGLNYLLNEQQDKAIDVFIRMLEVNSDTVETHLALGNLFRKRGEVDRAIRIHQNLVARNTLSEEQRHDALFELARDYLKAGLFDRAEGLFRELLNAGVHESGVLPLLVDIYQQEKDWNNAIAIAAQMGFIGGQPARSVIAQYYCELAENARAHGNLAELQQLLDRAGDYNPHCARVSLIRANLAFQQGEYTAALTAYEQVVERDIDLLPELIDKVRDCHVALGTRQSLITFLQKVGSLYHGITPALMLAELISQDQGEHEAAVFIAAELAKRPSLRGLARYIDLTLPSSAGAAQDGLLVLKGITDQMLKNKPVYKCGNCGFNGRSLHWQCPGCRQWNSIRPIHGVDGE